MAAVVNDRTKQREMAATGVAIRHVMKCRRGDKCPYMTCRELEDAMKERVIQVFTSSPLGMHYVKCREGLGGQILDRFGDPYSEFTVSNCRYCNHIRGGMKALKEKYFTESPMSLQLLAACAVPKDQIMDPHPHPHPHREELLRMKYSAARIQRRWRKFLYSRGPRYRTSLCRYYRRRGGCRNGVNCTFAHGNHDLRQSFRPPSTSEDFMGALPVPPRELLAAFRLPTKSDYLWLRE
jgi:hypothetical protein